MLLIFLSDKLTLINETKIIKITPNGTADMPEGSVGFVFKCTVEGDPTAKVTWSRGIRNDCS